MKQERVQKLIANYGFISRRKAEVLIQEGRVKVNDKLVSIGDICSEEDVIYVDNKPIEKEKRVYLMFNKPVGCVTAVSDPKFKTVIDYIKIPERIFPVGRLDYNTSGLLILTNDGEFANKIAHPRYETKKTYLVNIDKAITNQQLNQIENGIIIEGIKTSKAQTKTRSPTQVEVTIHEGRNRIVRKIFHELGFRIKTIERIKIGNLSLGNLKLKTYRFLTKEDTDHLFEK